MVLSKRCTQRIGCRLVGSLALPSLVLMGLGWIAVGGRAAQGAEPPKAGANRPRGPRGELLTDVTINPSFKDHPVLRGVQPFRAYSWLYHVEGGGDRLSGDCQRLLIGRALKTSHETKLDRFPMTNPVAWTKTSTAGSGLP